MGRPSNRWTVEQLNEFAIALLKSGMSANTVLHNIIIVAQFFRRNGRPGLTRELHLPEKISTLPREYSEEELERFFGVCDSFAKAMFSTFLLTGMREQEVMYLYWTDLKLSLRTVRITAKRIEVSIQSDGRNERFQYQMNS